jgi:hypothetical protein
MEGGGREFTRVTGNEKGFRDDEATTEQVALLSVHGIPGVSVIEIHTCTRR